MNQVIEVNIADILSRLETKFDKLEDKIDNLEKKFDDKIEKLEDKIDGLEKKFDNKIDGLEKKFDNKIDGLEKKFDDKFAHLSNEVNLVKVNVAKLDEKIVGVDKRLGNLEFIFRSIAGGIIIALILAAARYFFPNIAL